MPDHSRPPSVAWLARFRSDRRVAFAAAWLVTLLVAGWGGWQVWRAEAVPSTPPPALPAPLVGSTTAPTNVLSGSDRSIPVTISINAIELRAPVDQIGLAPDGTLEEQPFSRANHAAWYRLGPAPGQVGPAVIAGHVDTKSNIAVFFYLSRLRPGDRVVIARADRHTVTFTVDWLGSFPKSNFPTQLVYGPTNYPALRLITCGGSFDRTVGSYRDNIVVFAHLTART
jgi:Sortase domain